MKLVVQPSTAVNVKGNVLECHFSDVTSSQTLKGNDLKRHFYPAQAEQKEGRQSDFYLSQSVNTVVL